MGSLLEDNKKIAAVYIRMSTEHQIYSPEHQLAHIREYALNNKIRIETVYQDSGISGLTLKKRPALRALLSDVLSKDKKFNTILIFDISRWGRFQDIDESAHYEYVCRKAGCDVHYTAEPFSNDQGIYSNIIKALKRTMAGEFSRELSYKVWNAQSRLVQKGFHQGGSIVYGLRRQLVDESGNIKQTLKVGESKALRKDRVILIHGPDEEVSTIRAIYNFYLNGLSYSEISRHLNLIGPLRDKGKVWKPSHIKSILINEIYIGRYIYNRKSKKLAQLEKLNPEKDWIVFENFVPPIISKKTFNKVKAKMLKPSEEFSKEQLLVDLKELYKKHGYLTYDLINKAENIPCSQTYVNRFSSITAAYRAVGYNSYYNSESKELSRKLKIIFDEQIKIICSQLQKKRIPFTLDKDTGLLHLYDKFVIHLRYSRSHTSSRGRLKWLYRGLYTKKADFILLLCMNNDNNAILHYYFVPAIALNKTGFQVTEYSGHEISSYKIPRLNFLYEFFKNVSLTNAINR